MKSILNYIDGQFVRGEREFDDINPSDGTLIAHVTEADEDLVDEAVAAARRALQGEWGTLGTRERAARLHQVADAIESRFDCFVEAEVKDTGKPKALASRLDVPRAAANFRVFADAIKMAGLESETPATATLLAEVMQKAEIPNGVYNVVHGFGPNSAGEFLTEHPDVNAVTFTGESRTGAAIMKAVAPSVKPVSFELGGKNAAIVFADCDFEEAINGLSEAVFLNTGQVCLCVERVYVERVIFERFVNALKQKAESLRLGDPMEESTNLGPLISSQHRDKVLSYYKLAREEGAALVTGGGFPEFGNALDKGFYVQPTIYTGLAESARCVKEEIFGPVCHIAPFDTDEEAVVMANDTKYGLAASIWTTNLKRGHRVAQQMNVGITWVNCWFLRDLRTPFGGVGLSGIGREGGIHSLNFYSELNNICVRL